MFPDVGGTYALTHLPKAPWSVGLYLGLTGTRLGPGDCLDLGLATHFAPAARLEELVARLAANPPAALAERDERARFPAMEAELTAFDRWDEPQGSVAPHRARIEACFAAEGPHQLVQALADEPTGWGGEQLADLRTFSPLAVCLTHAQLSRGRVLDFDESLRVEYRLVQRVLEHGDFREGVRAMLIDKDRQPRWRHRSIEEVPPGEVEAFFVPLADAEDELRFDWEP
jgi:enoyl-CoA hydratase